MKCLLIEDYCGDHKLYLPKDFKGVGLRKYLHKALSDLYKQFQNG